MSMTAATPLFQMVQRGSQLAHCKLFPLLQPALVALSIILRLRRRQGGTIFIQQKHQKLSR